MSSREIFPFRVSKMWTSRISTFDPTSEASATDQEAHGPQNGLILSREPERSVKYGARVYPCTLRSQAIRAQT